MESSNESEIRLAELIWRTVKLRVSLLLLTVVALLVVWSSLSNGNREAERMDTTFCEYLVDQHNTVQQMADQQIRKSVQAKAGTHRPKPYVISPEDTCRVGSSRTWIEITRNTDKLFSWETSSPVDFFREAAIERRKAFDDYDVKRQEAYRLQIQLSSEQSSSTIVLNALTVAKIIPFCALVVLTIVVTLGFQQSAYRRQLGSYLRNSTDEDRFHVMAVTQFFAVPPRQRTPHPEKYLVVSPAGLAMGTLGSGVTLLLLGTVWSFVRSLAYFLTDSILLSYPFALYVSLFVLTCVLVVTRRSYAFGNFFWPISAV